MCCLSVFRFFRCFRVRSEGFSFNSRDLGMRDVAFMSQSSATATDRMRTIKALPVGESFGRGHRWKHEVSDSFRRT